MGRAWPVSKLAIEMTIASILNGPSIDEQHQFVLLGQHSQCVGPRWPASSFRFLEDSHERLAEFVALVDTIAEAKIHISFSGRP